MTLSYITEAGGFFCYLDIRCYELKGIIDSYHYHKVRFAMFNGHVAIYLYDLGGGDL